MSSNWYRNVIAFLLMACMLFSFALAEESALDLSETNPETGYAAAIEDGAGLLEDEDQALNRDIMIRVTAFCNAGFYTYDGEDPTNAEEKARIWGAKQFGDAPFTVFVIDMYTREVAIFSTSPVYYTITQDVANEILESTFIHATHGDYGKCAYDTFSLILEKLENDKAGPESTPVV